MKKRLPCLLLALVILFALLPCKTYAFDPSWYSTWPSFTAFASGKYETIPLSFTDQSGSEINIISVAGNWGGLIDADVAGTSVFTPVEFYTSNRININAFSWPSRIEAVQPTADYSSVQQWNIYNKDNPSRHYYYPVWAFSSSADSTVQLDRKAELWKLAPEIYKVMHQFDDLFTYYCSIQNADSVHIGKRYPSDLNYLVKVATGIQSAFSITTGFAYTHEYQLSGRGWQDESLLEGLKSYWENEYKWDDPYTTPSTITARGVEQLKFILHVVAPYFIDLFSSRVIAAPEITAFSVGTSKGIIDEVNKTITIRLPDSTDWTKLPEPVIETPQGVKATYFAGSLESGRMLYSVVPWDCATGTTFNGKNLDKYVFGVDLSESWLVTVENGTPYNRATSFAVTVNDVTRYGKIVEGENGEAGTIRLNLPVGTDLSALLPEIEHTGEYYRLDGASEDTAIDFTNSESQPIDLVIYNSEYELETTYKVTVTAKVSAENDILSYKIGDAIGVIDGNDIAIEIPYATNLAVTEPEIKVSEFAAVTAKPAALQVGENRYTVTAANGNKQDYTVTITRTPAASGCSILSFKYGGYAAEINEAAGSITLSVPRGTPMTFVPKIILSEFATISPSATEAQNFSQPVQYVVTAQDGSSSSYTVTVTLSDETLPNPYESDLEKVVANIIRRYRTMANNDWEWMNLGFYENISPNYNAGQGNDFDVGKIISQLDTTTSVAMTELGRTIMMLTARGFDCTNLAQYHDGVPYIDKKGNNVDDLAAALYNYSGTYTINGPTFALLAMDMGIYTIPSNAVWTRERLLETLLGHKYLSDGFGIDMVGAIMYAIGPYQDDPVYGDRVKAKMQEGLETILQKMSSSFSFEAWGDVNSESAAWVMMGLCSMGIDCHTDPRFSDGQGKSMLQHWMDNFANVSEGYFHHTTSVRNNALATYEGCYASQWYLKFLEGGGQGNPCYFYYHRFPFARQLSTDASITGFEIEGKPGVITEGGEGGENTITVTVPNGMPLTNLTPTVTMAEGATLLAPSLPVTFVEGIKQPFTVMAEDGKTTKTYNVTVTHGDVGASGAELDVNSIKLQNSVLNATDILEKKVTKASDGATEILLTVNAGVDTSKMYLSASLSYKATSDPSLDGKKVMDFSDWKTFTVTSGDKTVQNTYRIKVVSKAQAEITSFRVQAVGEWYNGVIDNAKSTITVTDVDDSKLTSTKLVTDIEFTGRSCSPTSGIAVDFANAATFTLGGDNDLASRTYTVIVLNKSGQPISAKGSGGDDDTPSTSTAKITGFSVLGVDGVIDQSAGIITVTLPAGTNVTAVAPVVTVPAGAVVSPVSGEVVNLTSPLTYAVTLGAESTSYTVTVIFERSISQQLWGAVAENSDVADHQTSYGHKFN